MPICKCGTYWGHVKKGDDKYTMCTECKLKADRAIVDAAFKWRRAYTNYLKTPDCGCFRTCECYKEEVNIAQEKLSRAILNHPDYENK